MLPTSHVNIKKIKISYQLGKPFFISSSSSAIKPFPTSKSYIGVSSADPGINNSIGYVLQLSKEIMSTIRSI